MLSDLEREKIVKKAEKENTEKLLSWMSQATEYLINKGRSEDIAKLTTNDEFRNQLFKELHLG